MPRLLSCLAPASLPMILCLMTFSSALPAQPVPSVASLPVPNWLTPYPMTSPPMASSSAIAPPTKLAASASYSRLPLSFEPNVGQVNKRAQFLCRGAGYSLFLTPTGAVLSMQRSAVSATLAKRNGRCLPPQRETKLPSISGVALYMTLLGANPQAKGVGESQQPGVVSYFVGKDRSQWHSGISTFGQVRYCHVYPGVDLLYYGNNHQLEYDLIVKPGADYHRAALQFSGAQSVRLDRAGNLQLKLSGGQTVWKRPVAYQVGENGKKQWVASRYVLNEKHKTVRFVVGRYDKKRTLVLDPGLVYSTYLGGSSQIGDGGNGIAVDGNGNTYIVGTAFSTDFPVTPGAFQTVDKNPGWYRSVFVTKLNAYGTSLVYSTYLGGSLAGDYGNKVVVDSSSNAYITGQVNSTDFPITPGAFQITNKGRSGNAFVAKLNATGTSLLYSTYLGGSQFDVGSDIAIDGDGNAYITGSAGSSDFPVTLGAFQTDKNRYHGYIAPFITKLNATGTALVYSTFLGGSNSGGGSMSIKVDNSGNVYITGSANSDFPTTPGAFQTATNGSDILSNTAVVTKLNADGTALLYSTFLGAIGGARANGIAIDNDGNAYITGTAGYGAYPITPGAFQTTNKGAPNRSENAFITKLNATGSALVYSTYLGGTALGLGDTAYGIAIDRNGDAYITGETNSPDFPTTTGAFQTTKMENGANYNVFVAKLNSTGSTLLYSTYLGGSGSPLTGDIASGIATDGSNVYITGITSSPDFPTTHGAFQTTNHGGPDGYGGQAANAFVARLMLPVLRPRLDLNGDGHLDILWQDQKTGDLYAWLQNGLTTLGPDYLAFALDSRWKETGVADLNGDGNADLLWRNQATGDLYVWYMQGARITASVFLAHHVPLDWQLVTTSDLNGDGKTDLLWQNRQTGDLAVWYMQGSTLASSIYLAHAVPLNWQLVGSADFNGNGHTDLLWRNTQTGDLSVWEMNNTQLVSSAYLAQAVPLEWQIGAVGDLDGNGVPDIVWRNTKTGDVGVWLFSDATHYSGVSLAAGIPLNWQLVGPR